MGRVEVQLTALYQCSIDSSRIRSVQTKLFHSIDTVYVALGTPCALTLEPDRCLYCKTYTFGSANQSRRGSAHQRLSVTHNRWSAFPSNLTAEC